MRRSRLPPPKFLRSSMKCGPRKPQLNSNNNPAVPVLTGKFHALSYRHLTSAISAKFAGSADNPEGFEGDLGLYSDAPLGSSWFATLSPELKDEVVDCALGVVAKNTRFLELEADGGNNAEYYKLTTSVARSDAPNAEDIFVKHASRAKNADTEEALRQHFSRCSASQPSGNLEITVGTLLHLAQQVGANFDQWKRQVPSVAPLPLVTWSAVDLNVSFSNIPHRPWLYGVDLVRGEITVVGSPGGVGKTSLAIGMGGLYCNRQGAPRGEDLGRR